MKKEFLNLKTFDYNIFTDQNIVAVDLYSNNIMRLLDMIENGIPSRSKNIYLGRFLDVKEAHNEELNIRSPEESLGLCVLVDIKDILVDEICVDVAPKDIAGIIVDEETLYQDLRNFNLDLYGAGTALTNEICADVISLMKMKHGYEFDYSILKELLFNINNIKVTEENMNYSVGPKVYAVQELDNYISACIYDFLASKLNSDDINLKDVIDHFNTRKVPIYDKNGYLIDNSRSVEKVVYKKKL